MIAALGVRPANTYVDALALMSAHHQAWLRTVEDWRPRSHNARRQFQTLIRHLFVRYDDMPLFFDSVWHADGAAEAIEQRKWYLHVANGQNIRHCPLPLALTKRMTHHFMHAPEDLTVPQALRWSQVQGLGGDDCMARTILGTWLGESFEHEEFWQIVIQWLIAQPMPDRVHVGPMIDYLHHQRFEPQDVYVGPGVRCVYVRAAAVT